MNIDRTKKLIKQTKQMMKFIALANELTNEKIVFTLKEDRDLPECVEPPQMPEGPIEDAEDAIQQLLRGGMSMGGGHRCEPPMKKASINFDREDEKIVLGAVKEYAARELINKKNELKKEILGEEYKARKQGKKKVNVDEMIEEMLAAPEEPEGFRVALFKIITGTGVVEGKYKTDGLKTKIDIMKAPPKWAEFKFELRSSLFSNSDDKVNIKELKEPDILNDLVYYFGSYGQALDTKKIVELNIVE